jgi:hypothetical protein
MINIDWINDYNEYFKIGMTLKDDNLIICCAYIYIYIMAVNHYIIKMMNILLKNGTASTVKD